MVLPFLVEDIARAVGFLSRLPAPARYFEGYDGSLTRASRAFPLAGLVVAAPGAAVLGVLLALKLEATLASIIAYGILCAVTGALHEDGLADSADGLGATRDKDRALMIMRDSRIGSFGAVVLILSLALRVTGLAAIAAAIGPLGATLVFLGAAAVSRGAMVSHWLRLPPARTDGLAVSMGGPDGPSALFARVSGLVAAFVLFGFAAGPLAAIGALAAVECASIGWRRYVAHRLGGHTGDTIGAAQQLTEIGALIGLALFT